MRGICLWYLLNCAVTKRVFITSSDGRVVRASALGAIDSGLIPSRVEPMTFQLVFTASLLDAQH